MRSPETITAGLLKEVVPHIVSCGRVVIRLFAVSTRVSRRKDDRTQVNEWNETPCARKYQLIDGTLDRGEQPVPGVVCRYEQHVNAFPAATVRVHRFGRREEEEPGALHNSV